MHPTAMLNCKHFFDTYAAAFNGQRVKVIDIGAQDINGSLRAVCPEHFDYCGVDFVAAKGVDVVLDDPYQLPFDSNSIDIVLSSSCFEHSEMFWLLFLEIMRILKPHGLLYLNAPANGIFHRHPVDSWRFYPDSGRALITWARRNHMVPALLESFTSEQTGAKWQIGNKWNDYVGIFVKDENEAVRYPNRVCSGRPDLFNVIQLAHDEITNYQYMPEDMRKLEAIHKVLNNEVVLPDDQARIQYIKRIMHNEIKVR